MRHDPSPRGDAARRAARALAATATATAALVAIAVPPSAPAQSPSVPTYTVRTVFLSPSGEEVRNRARGVPGQPLTVDVDRSGVPDVLVDLVPVATKGLALKVVRLPGAPARLRAAVSATVDLPDPGGTATFGYDATASDAPLSFDQTVLTDLVGEGPSFDFAVERPGGRLRMLAEVADQTAVGGRKDPVAASVDFPGPVPASGHVRVSESGAVQRVNAGVTPPAPAEIDVTQRKGELERTVRAAVRDVPADVTVELTRDAAGEVQAADYQATREIASADITVEDHRVGAGDAQLQRQVIARLADVPMRANLDRSGTTTTFRAGNGPADGDGPADLDGLTPPPASFSAEVGFATGRPVQRLQEATYLNAVEDADRRTLAFRAVGVSFAQFRTGDPLTAKLSHTPRPFHAIVKRGTFDLDAVVDTPPADMTFTLDKAGGSATYHAEGGRTALVRVEAFDSARLIGPARRLRLKATGIPSDLRAEFTAPAAGGQGKFEEEITEDPEGDGGGTTPVPPTEGRPPVQGPVTKRFAITSVGEPIESATVLLGSERTTTSTTDRAFVTGTEDGFLLEDLDDHFFLFGRIHGLRSAALKQVRSSQRKEAVVDIDAVTPEPVRAHFERDPGSGKVERVIAELPSLAPSTHLGFSTLVQDARNTETRVDYSAAAEVPRLDVETNAGAREHLEATVAPLPTSLSLCVDGYGRCAPEGTAKIGLVDVGSVNMAARVDASKEVAVTLFDCQERRSDARTCFRAEDAQKYVDLNLGRVQHAGFAEDVDLGTDEEWVFVDTDFRPLQGRVRLFKRGASPNLELRIPPGFVAQDRVVGFDLFAFPSPEQEHHAGSVVCPSTLFVAFGAIPDALTTGLARKILCGDRGTRI